MRSVRRPVALVMALLAGPAAAEAPRLGAYAPLHPGLYAHTSLRHDARDASFDADGQRVRGVAPASGGETRFPQSALTLALEWHLPLFELQEVPFFSGRHHLVRVQMQQVQTEARGALVDASGLPVEARGREGSGLGDLQVDVGSFLFGSPVGSRNGREGPALPWALQLRLGVDIPFGVYARDAPVSAGDNTWAYRAALGAHARPWQGALLDLGLRWQTYGVNEEPLFGALAPRQRGSSVALDLSLSQRLAPGWHLGVYGEAMQGADNRYRNPRFSVPSPVPPAGTEAVPVAGDYRDDGIRSVRAGLSLYRFVGQRWVAGLHADGAISGRSGAFDLPYENRRPAGCQPGAIGCTVSAGETVRVDGLGPARAYASTRYHLSLRYQFGLGDPYPCTGCERSSP